MRLAVHLQRNLDLHVLVLLVLMSSFVETRAVPEGRHGPTSARMSRSGAVSSVGGSCFVAGAGRRRRFVALRPRARVRCRIHAIEGSPLAAR